MTNAFTNRDPDDCVETNITNKETMYSVNVTGASVTADSSIGLIDRYCKKLPRDKYGFSSLPFSNQEGEFLILCFDFIVVQHL